MACELFRADYFCGIAAMALWAARRESLSGHGLVFISLMLFPAAVAAAWWAREPVPLLRYVAIVPVVLSGMAVLTVGLVRAQRQAVSQLLRAEQAEAAVRLANGSLEQRVAQRTAELHEMVEGLEAFNRNVSHDLRGPLGGIAGASRVAEEALQQGDAATATQMMQAITAQADSSVQLVAALLALARVADAPFEPRRVALQSVVDGALEQVRLARPEAGALPVTVDGPLPEVQADPGLLRQVYVNLVSNALKFSAQAEHPQIEIGVHRATREAAPTYFVRDNGVGFDSERAQQLFEPFKRLHGTRFAGHGVGLSIVKRIVERHGGRIWAESTPGRGATFSFTLGERPP